MNYPEAKRIADRLVETFEPVCERVEIAGSIRRLKEEPRDIELCVIPAVGGGLFGDGNALADWLASSPPELGRRVKGKDDGKYLQFALPDGVNLDLFVCSSETWGVNVTVRTGSAEFSHEVAGRWVRMGFKSEGARLRHRDGWIAETPTEQSVFDLLRLRWVDPVDRRSGQDVRGNNGG